MRALDEGNGIHRDSLTSGAQCVGGVDPSDRVLSALRTKSRKFHDCMPCWYVTCKEDRRRGRLFGPETSSLSVGIPHF
jgi:hypothetical protein